MASYNERDGGGGGGGGGGGYDDYSRPRRVDPQTVAYLRSLPLDETLAEQEIQAYLGNKRRRQRQEQKEQKEQDDDEDNDVEYPQSLSAAHAAIDEIVKELASLACDEHGSQTIEIIARITVAHGRSDKAARRLLAGLSGYHLHLACHRFGSHVVQTIMACAASAAAAPTSAGDHGDDEQERKWLAEEEEEEVTAKDNEETANLPSVTELVLAAAEELLPHSKELAVHVCGSHVLRTLFCVLGGVELVPARGASGNGTSSTQRLELGGARRGKAKDPKAKKKKKKKKTPAAEDDAAAGGGSGTDVMRRVEHSRIDIANVAVRDALRSAAISFSSGSSSGPGELQQLACHPSAGPLLAVLLRVLTHSSAPNINISPSSKDVTNASVERQDFDKKAISDHRLGISPSEPTFGANSDASVLAKGILCWDESVKDSTKQPYASDVIYGLSGEPRGSIVLETILRVSDNSFHDDVCRVGGFFDAKAFKDYSEHNVSNFVLQTLFVSVRSKDQADQLVKCILPLVSSGFVIEKSKRRGGLLWRATEMCAKYKIGQEELIVAIRSGFTALVDRNSCDDAKAGANGSSNTSVAGEEPEGKKMRHKKRKREEDESLLSMEQCIPLLVGLKAPLRDGARAMLDVAGARTIYNLLHFSPNLCRDVLDGITKSFSSQELEWIANDGLGSRCIMDAIMEGPTDKKPFSGACRKVLEKLDGRWVALSVERVGHHLVQNLFKALSSLDDKAALASELARGISRLGGNAMGRKVMTTCAVKEFLEGEMVWKEAVAKQICRDEILKELMEAVVDKEAATSGADGGNTGSKEGVDGDGDGDGKRKRKRKKKKKKDDSDDA